MNIYREAPIKLEPEVTAPETEASYLTFDIRLGPGTGANVSKYRSRVKKYTGGTKEEWLKWREEVSTLVTDVPLSTPDAVHRAVKGLLRGDALARYTRVIAALQDPPTLDDINNRLDDMTMELMSIDSIRLTLEYLRQVRKPRTMSVQDFLARIVEINSKIPFMPGGIVEDKLNDEQLKQIIENGVPVAWRRQQRSAHLISFDLQETVSYFDELQALENESFRRNNNNNANNKNKNHTTVQEN
ncbi:MAG: hypothetical protein ACRDL7_00850 [Gaiellaceae bacterium]